MQGRFREDVLLLTKATGVITTALKQGKAEPLWLENAIRSMTALNRTAAEVITQVQGVHSMTDITGFGLMGHGREMAMASGVTLEIEVEAVPHQPKACDVRHAVNALDLRSQRRRSPVERRHGSYCILYPKRLCRFPCFRAVVMTPVPIALVRRSTSPGIAPAFV